MKHQWFQPYRIVKERKFYGPLIAVLVESVQRKIFMKFVYSVILSVLLLQSAAVNADPIDNSPEGIERIEKLQEIWEPKMHKAYELILGRLRTVDVSDNTRIFYAFAITNYFMKHLKLPVPTAANLKKSVFGKTLDNILISSTQFLVCPVEDWECLERTPELIPKDSARIDVSEDLGKPVLAGESLEIEAFFTRRWWERKAKIKSVNPTLAEIFAKKIKTDGTKRASLALYGIDHIADTMKPVYDSILETLHNGSDVRGVFDQSEEGSANSFLRDYDVEIKGKNVKAVPVEEGALSFDYASQDSEASVFGTPSWMKALIQMGAKGITPTVSLSPGLSTQYEKDIKWLTNSMNATKAGTMVRMAFQYQDTIDLILSMNANIASNAQSRARVEWPARGLMHNKFAVLENDQGEKFVWTGTTNVADTCMGSEENANVAVYIKNEMIADAFEQEFSEMFDTKGKVAEDRPYAGKFHGEKRPNTKRYFIFKDGTEVRLHFSPTDDGMHRAILPMLASAKKGDRIRISMFGGAGFEFVRALQMAQRMGADIQISMDNLTGAGPSTWAKNKEYNVFMKNPFVKEHWWQKPKLINELGKMEFRFSNWDGLNHHKTGTLERLQPDGSYITEVMIVGSQNWSDGGNDVNDENMITIRNKSTSIAVGDEFNRQFDQHIWPNSAIPKNLGPVKVSAPPKGVPGKSSQKKQFETKEAG